MFSVKPQEVKAHEQYIRPFQPPRRSSAPIQAPDHSPCAGPPTGPSDRHPGLDRIGAPSPAGSSSKTQKRRWAAAALACLLGCHAADGHPQADLPGGRGPDPLLRPRAVLVRVDRNAVDPGLHDHPGLHPTDGRGRDQTHQSIRGANGGETEVGGPQDCGRRHDCPRSGDPLSQRDGAHDSLPDLGGKCSPEGRPRAEGICGADGRSIQSGQAESSRIPLICQDQGEQESGDETDGRHRREVERESGGGVGRPCRTASKATQVCRSWPRASWCNCAKR